MRTRLLVDEVDLIMSDYDGVFSPIDEIALCVALTCKHYGRPAPTLDEHRHDFSGHMSEYWRIVVGIPSNVSDKELYEVYFGFWHKIKQRRQHFTEVRPFLLEAARRNKPVGILTSGSRQAIRALLKRDQLLDRITGPFVARKDEKGAALEVLCKKKSLPPIHRILFIDDLRKNVEDVLSVGAHSVAIAREPLAPTAEAKRAKATAIVPTLMSIFKLKAEI